MRVAARTAALAALALLTTQCGGDEVATSSGTSEGALASHASSAAASEPGASSSDGALPGAVATQDADEPLVYGPGTAPVDAFHPDRVEGAAPPKPARGGRIIVRYEAMPKSLNRMIDNSAIVTYLHYALHDTLLHQDWEYWTWNPRLCTSYDVEDGVVLKPGAAGKYGDAVHTITRPGEDAGAGATTAILYGDAAVSEDGTIVVTPKSKASELSAPVTVASEDVESVQRGTVFTFYLREGVKWHDGHVFDADDVRFTWDAYRMPGVDSEKTRSLYDKVTDCTIPAPMTVRFFYERQFYQATEVVGELPILPRHLYDLLDPDNATYDPKTHAELARVHGDDYDPTVEERARYVNENVHNHEFVGLGAYRVTEVTEQFVDAVRFDDYWDADDPKYGGYLDAIRWRIIASDATAFQALINGEIDFFDRVRAEEYFGGATEAPEFTENYYKGYYYTGIYAYTAWNVQRPKFSDPRVRRALAHAVDLEEFIRTRYYGLAKNVSGPPHYFSDAYDHSVLPPELDPAKAEELLAEAGWYDRDGDGIIDKDGVPFVFEYLFPTGNESGRNFGLLLQESLGELGIKVDLANLEFATMLDRIYERDFDAINLAWVPELESDPEQLWHSKWGAPGVRGSNRGGFQDAEVDRLIELIQEELDRDARMEHWHAFHRRIASLDPYLFMVNPARKFAMNKRFRGMQNFMIPPGYSVRRLYLPEGTPGTRPLSR